MSKMSTSWMANEDDEVDPFALLEENQGILGSEDDIAREKDAKLQERTEQLIGHLKTSQPDTELKLVTTELLDILAKSPEKKSIILKSHTMLPILEILQTNPPASISLDLLKLINMVIFDDSEAQESLCFIGGIPIITSFSHHQFSSDIRKQSAAFVRQMCQTSILTLQMFIGCGGLNVLSGYLEEDFDTERDLVLIGITGVWSVFELQVQSQNNTMISTHILTTCRGLLLRMISVVFLPATLSLTLCL
jgi:hypothetical protein